MDVNWDTIIVGAGPAGLAAAGACHGKILVLDRMDQPGRKLLVTGGGRCNVTHETDADGVMQAFGRHGRFMRQALSGWSPADIRAFLLARGVPTCVEPDGCVFPVSQRARDVLAALEGEARSNGAVFQFGCRVEGLLLESGHIAGVVTAHGEFRARRVILATGGRSYPESGSDGSGFELAANAGLTVTPQVPALAGLVLAESWVPTLAGAALENACVRLAKKGGDRDICCGPVLFTHRGLSGPSALAISGEIAWRLKQGESSVALTMSVDAERTEADWLADFDEWRRAAGAKKVVSKLAALFTKRMAQTFCAVTEIGETTCARLRKDEALRLARFLSAMPMTVVGTEGWDSAMVTRGGVALEELDPATLACRRVPGLFCIGEMDDLDGICGGYNLTWALASGRLAGLKADKVI